MRAVYFTMDTDWCHEEILQFALHLFHRRALPCTVFATGAYAGLRELDAARFEVGVHPNFNGVASGGCEGKLRELRGLYPRARGVASHAMASSTPLLDLFKQQGFEYDRNLLCYKTAGAQPFRHYNGLLRLPVFWEDDIWFGSEPGARFAPDLLSGECFRLIFNFHPIHLFMNTASAEHYLAFKPHQHEIARLTNWRREQYGVLSFFEDLTAYLQAEKLATGLLQDFLQT